MHICRIVCSSDRDIHPIQARKCDEYALYFSKQHGKVCTVGLPHTLLEKQNFSHKDIPNIAYIRRTQHMFDLYESDDFQIR